MEEQFYILFPLFLIAVQKLTFRVMMWLIVSVGVFSFLLANLAPIFVAHPKVFSGSFYFLPTRAWELLIGAGAALWMQSELRGKASVNIKSLASWAGISMILFSVVWFTVETFHPSYLTLIPVLGALLCILFADEDTYIGRCLGNYYLVKVGLLSYSLYLFHAPVFVFLKYLDYQTFFVSWIAILATCIISALNWQFIETPMRKEAKVNVRKFMCIICIAGLVIGAVGIVGIVKEGNVYKYTSSQWEILGKRPSREHYVWGRMKELKLSDYSAGKKNLLIIGDSFAGDLVNIFFESGIAKEFSFSTFVIPKQCGNVYTRADISQHIPKREYSRCKRIGWYSNDELREAIRSSDHVLLASSWDRWTLNYIEQTMINLKSEI